MESGKSTWIHQVAIQEKPIKIVYIRGDCENENKNIICNIYSSTNYAIV